MKRFILLMFVFAAFISGCSESNDEDPKTIVETPDEEVPVITKQNVLFIIADDLTKTLGTYGHPVVKTPNIDKLASMGVQYNNAYSNYSVCNPSRSSFLTGLKPETTTIMDNFVHLQDILGPE